MVHQRERDVMALQCPAGRGHSPEGSSLARVTGPYRQGKQSI